MISINFDKSEAEHFLDCLTHGKPIQPLGKLATGTGPGRPGGAGGLGTGTGSDTGARSWKGSFPLFAHNFSSCCRACWLDRSRWPGVLGAGASTARSSCLFSASRKAWSRRSQACCGARSRFSKRLSGVAGHGDHFIRTGSPRWVSREGRHRGRFPARHRNRLACRGISRTRPSLPH